MAGDGGGGGREAGGGGVGGGQGCFYLCNRLGLHSLKNLRTVPIGWSDLAGDEGGGKAWGGAPESSVGATGGTP